MVVLWQSRAIVKRTNALSVVSHGRFGGYWCSLRRTDRASAADSLRALPLEQIILICHSATHRDRKRLQLHFHRRFSGALIVGASILGCPIIIPVVNDVCR